MNRSTLNPTRLTSCRNRLTEKLGQVPDMFLLVCIDLQRLFVIKRTDIEREYKVSTAKKGTGNKEDSLKTPLGIHRVVEKYGKGAPLGRIFRDREDAGENWTIGTPAEDLILTRILRLAGLEERINKGPGIDSYERYIYIHGTNNEHLIGTPASHGCVCMRNADVVKLFDAVPEGTIVIID